MSTKKKFPRDEALDVAKEIYDRLKPFCEKLKICGSLRRHKPFVSDIEVLFIPKMAINPETFFNALMGADADMVSMADIAINRMVRDGYLAKRPNTNGVTAWGPQNKLGMHVQSGIPVDFFTTSADNWWNSLVVRTGGKRSNLEVTMAANKRGYRFEAYGSGFQKISGPGRHESTSEEDIFKFVGLPYLEPQFRP